jgi:hypothetical protein
MFKSINARNTGCDAIIRLVDVGTDHSSAGIYIYDSTDFPRFFPDTTSPTPITRLAMSNPAFMDATDGTAYANIIYDATSFRDGTAGGFGVFNCDSTFVWGGTVSGPTGLGDMKLNQVVIKQDQTVTLTTAYYLVP